MSWRDLMPVHPAADMLPMLDDADLVALGNDIKANGLTSPIVIAIEDGQPGLLIDGRNRLAAMERVGLRVELVLEEETTSPHPEDWIWALYSYEGDKQLKAENVTVLGAHADFVAYIISANFHRRHLTQETKRALIAQLLKETPERSDRATAELVKVDHKTVAVVRRQGEDVGSIPHVAKRVDSKGRRQPANKRAARAASTSTPTKPEAAKTAAAKPATVMPALPKSDGMTVTLKEEWREILVDGAEHAGVSVAAFVDLLLALGSVWYAQLHEKPGRSLPSDPAPDDAASSHKQDDTFPDLPACLDRRAEAASG
jgi:hypothetical protein